MRIIAIIILMASMLCFAYEEEFDLSYDSWGIGKPDNIPETQVIIMGQNCECNE